MIIKLGPGRGVGIQASKLYSKLTLNKEDVGVTSRPLTNGTLGSGNKRTITRIYADMPWGAETPRQKPGRRGNGDALQTRRAKEP